jgi:hypothetical protein
MILKENSLKFQFLSLCSLPNKWLQVFYLTTPSAWSNVGSDSALANYQPTRRGIGLIAWILASQSSF